MTPAQEIEAESKCKLCGGNGRIDMLEHCPSCGGCGLSPSACSRRIRELEAALTAAAEQEAERDWPDAEGVWSRCGLLYLVEEHENLVGQKIFTAFDGLGNQQWPSNQDIHGHWLPCKVIVPPALPERPAVPAKPPMISGISDEVPYSIRDRGFWVRMDRKPGLWLCVAGQNSGTTCRVENLHMVDVTESDAEGIKQFDSDLELWRRERGEA
jgi:hypothetical protein